MNKNYIYVLSIFCTLSEVNIMIGVMGKIGGNDLFASLAQLEILWYNERDTIIVMDRIATKWKDMPGFFHM